jgi:hypothetical protein
MKINNRNKGEQNLRRNYIEGIPEIKRTG